MSELVTGILAAGAALAGAWIVGRQAAAQNRDRLAHERAMAGEARRQERITGAYLALLDAVNDADRLVETDAVDRERPDYESCDARLAGVWTALDAFGSDMVRERFNAWRAAWMLFKVDIHNSRVVGDRRDRALEQTRRDALEAARALRAQVRTELGTIE
ncbi:MAG TPA: hypothetical protein VFJ85_01095 [Acidimicrobiales bacterium]|nr:hypothetical protein [Acidimicrobiales bacterium]